MDRKPQVAVVAVLAAGSALAEVVVSAGRRTAEMVTERLAERFGAREQQDPARWQVVTIYRPIEELEQAVPEPLARLGDAIEVQIRQGPDSRGTEVAARLSPSRVARPEVPGPTPGELRTALRRAKQLCEVGWIHEANVTGTTRTTPTPLDPPLQEESRDATGEVRL